MANTMANQRSSWLKYEECDNQYSRDDITVASGQNLVAGAVLGVVTASGKYAAYNPTLTNGTETAAGVLLNDANATSADKAGVSIKRFAVLSKDGLTWGAGVTTAQHKTDAYADLKAIGILTRAYV